MNLKSKFRLLRGALRDIRELTFSSRDLCTTCNIANCGIKGHHTRAEVEMAANPGKDIEPDPLPERLEAWARIQEIVARVFRETDDL
jgi:hypothetical protein